MGVPFEYLAGFDVFKIICHQRNDEMYKKNITYGVSFLSLALIIFGITGWQLAWMIRFKEIIIFCIIDEADSILIDEARTPLIISGPMREDHPLPFKEMKPLVMKVFDAQLKQCNRLWRRRKSPFPRRYRRGASR